MAGIMAGAVAGIMTGIMAGGVTGFGGIGRRPEKFLIVHNIWVDR
jgi:hypothetical protein